MDEGYGEIEIPAGESRTWSALVHVSALSSLLIGIGFVVGPLVIWLIKREQLPAVDQAGKEALNFNISFFLWAVAAGLSLIVLIGFVLLPAIFIAWVVLVIVATVKASNGEQYRYPLTVRLIK